MLVRKRRGQTDRPHRLAGLFAEGVERLDSRVLMAGSVGLQAGFVAHFGTSDYVHAFKITGVDEDPGNTGLINKTSATLHFEIDRKPLLFPPAAHNPNDPNPKDPTQAPELQVTILNDANPKNPVTVTGTLNPANTELDFVATVSLTTGQNNLTFQVQDTALKVGADVSVADLSDPKNKPFSPGGSTFGTGSFLGKLTETLTVDQTAPTISDVTSTPTNHKYGANQTVPIEVHFTKPVTVTGNPTLQLGPGSASFAGVSNDTLTFNYLVKPGDAANPLDYTGASALAANGAVIQDLFGNQANLSLPTTASGHSLAQSNIVINTTLPAGVAPSLLPADNTGLNKGQNLTKVSQGLTFTGNANPGVTTVKVSIFKRDPATGANMGLAVASHSATPAGNLSYSVNFPETLADGPYNVTAVFTDANQNASPPTDPLTPPLTIDTTPPAAPAAPQLTTGSAFTSATKPSFTVSGIEPNARVSLLRDGVEVTHLDLNPPNGPVIVPGPGGTVTITDPGPIAQGTHSYTVSQTDAAGNPSLTASPTTAIAIDKTLPVISNLKLVDTNPNTNGLPVAVTNNQTPLIRLDLTDQTFTLADNPVKVVVTDTVGGKTSQILPDQFIIFGKGTDLASPTLSPTYMLPKLAFGNHQIVVTATDAAGNQSAQPLSLVIVNTNGGNATPGAPGTPIFSTSLSLAKIPGASTANPEFPWTMSFDRTTQTLWVDLRGGDEVSGKQGGGDQVIQLDPATGITHVYNLRGLDPVPAGKTSADVNGEPHGVFFDFESHLTPRIWFTRREDGFLSYIDPTNNTLVTYNIASILGTLGIKSLLAPPTPAKFDLHAVDVDPTGKVWISDMEDGLILELDLHKFDGLPNPTLDATNGTLIIHTLPGALITKPGIPVQKGAEPLVGPHGIDVVTDDQTGLSSVWFSDMGANGTVALLRAGAGPNGSDLWTTWDVSPALNEGTAPTKPGDPPITAGAPVFATIDNNETPGRPQDDRIWFADPGAGSLGAPSGHNKDLVRELIPGPLPTTNATSTATLQTWALPPIPGSQSPLQPNQAQPNQVYIDREGNVFYIDRASGIGRIDAASPPFNKTSLPPVSVSGPTSATVTGTTIVSNDVVSNRIIPTITQSFTPTTVTLTEIPPIAGNLSQTTGSTLGDLSQTTGLNQYAVLGSNANQRGQGPFRGTITAGSVVFGSLAQSDVVTSSIYADTVRRPMAVTTGPGTARQAFQVFRNGDLVMTYHDNGEVIDHQVDLTQTFHLPPIHGDPSAVTDAQGIIHLFGRDAQGGLLEFFTDRHGSAASAHEITDLPTSAGLIAANPTAFIPNPSAPVPSALATTSQGHLLLVTFNAPTIDLTARAVGAGSPLVYSSVGVTASNGIVYIYGTNQTGGLVEYQYHLADASVTYRQVNLPPERDVKVFQDVEAITTPDGIRHIFATDGTSRLVHITTTGPGTDFAENLTAKYQKDAIGYSPYQQPYAGRMYSDVSVGFDGTTGTLYVYGNNGRDLIEYANHAGSWQITDLTNQLAPGVSNAANRVFGTPTVTIQPNGDREILMISEDGEVVQYQKRAASPFFNTANITLSLGNSGSPPAFPNSGPVTTPAQPVPPAVTSLTFDVTGRNAGANGFNQGPGDTSYFAFRATFTERIVFNVAAPTTGFGAGLVPLLVFSDGKHASTANGRRHGNQIMASLQRNVIKGQTYYLAVQGLKRTSGSFTIAGGYLSVVTPRGPAGIKRTAARVRVAKVR